MNITHFLTAQSPWAQLIASWPELDTYEASGGRVIEAKRIENRTWAPPAGVIGHKIAIHAGKAFDDVANFLIRERARDAGITVPYPSEMPGGVIAVARVVGYIDTRGDQLKLVGRLPQRWAAEPLNAITTDAHWWMGPVGWLFDDVVRLPVPVPMPGKLGLQPMRADVAEAVNEQMRWHIDGRELAAMPPPPRAQGRAGGWVNKWCSLSGWWQEWIPAEVAP